MTSKLVVNTIEADTGISSVSFASSISMDSTSKFHFSAAGVDIGADTNINRPAAGVLGFNISGAEKLRIDTNGHLNTSGIVTAANFKSGVTNVHNLGVTLTGGQLDVGSNIKIGTAGVVTATSFVGSGAQLTGITQTTINNNTNNYVVTATGTANTLNGEANLLFDGGTLALNGRYQRGSATVQDGEAIAGALNINGTDMDSSIIMSVFGNDNDFTRISGSKSRNASVGSHTIVQNNDVLLSLKGFGSDGTNFEEAAQIEMQVDGTPGNNVMPGRIVFKTATTDGVAERLRISSQGYVTKPNTPFFSVYGSASNQTYNVGDDITFENAVQNVGNHFKMTSGTGQYQRFIVPVDGVYMFTMGFFPNTASTCRISLTVNGGVQTNPYISGCFSNWGTGSPVPMGTQMLKLTAGQYVTCQIQIGTLTNTYDGHTGFQGFLLG